MISTPDHPAGCEAISVSAAPPVGMPILPTSEPTTFHSFQKLPVELRFEIWKTLINPRIVPIVGKKRRVYSIAPVPVILQVSQEARQIGLSFYDTSIGLVYEGFDNAAWYEKDFTHHKIYFNPKLDLLYLSARYKLLQYISPKLSKFTGKGATIAIEHDIFCRYLRAAAPIRRHEITSESLKFFLELENIRLVFEDPKLVSKCDLAPITIDKKRELLRHGAQISVPGRIASLCRGNQYPKVTFERMISKSRSTEIDSADNGYMTWDKEDGWVNLRYRR